MIRSSLLFVLTCVALAGCQPPSTSPNLDDRPLSAQDADRQYKARLLVLKDGQTTRQEVVSVMGEPDRMTDDKKVILYYWTVKAQDQEQLRRSFVLAAFGPSDVLVRHRVTDDEVKYGGAQLPADALNEFLDYPAKK